MNKWIIGARVKTLPAAVAPVLIGTAYATQISWLNAALAMTVALFLQIAVNYSNDYSDGIKGTDANRVDTASITLRLGMHLRISIDLAGARKQESSPDPSCQAQHVVGAEKTGFGRFDRIELVMHRRSWTGQVPDPIDLETNRVGDIVADQLKVAVP